MVERWGRRADRPTLLDREARLPARRPLDARDPASGFLPDPPLRGLPAQLGISRSLLSDRLGKLVEAGILRREPYKDEVRTREEYRLTEKGLDLYPVLMALREWGDKHMAPEGAPILVSHRGCGGEVRTALRCEACGGDVGARDAEVAVGPGLKHLASA